MSNILIVGGDGFVGWPLSLELAKSKHNVTIVDNFMRRAIDLELNAESVVPISTMQDRIAAAEEILDVKINFEYIDVINEVEKLKDILIKNDIDTVVHLGEIRSAPYSMLSPEKSRLTVSGNISATHNILSAILEVNSDIHLVHMGTMGVYGYNDAFGEIPEGYLDVTVDQTGSQTQILFPTNPGSIYHMTKSLDQILFAFYSKTWGIKVTDLHQGIVWGAATNLTSLDTRLANRFDYDGEFGTVLNRFAVESAVNYPLTVYGTGGQARAFIHIGDSVKCVRLAIENPPQENIVRIFNQVSEVKRVRDLAEWISSKTGVEIKNIENPRKEAAENELFVKNDGLRSLGFEPTLLSDELLNDVLYLANNHSSRVRSAVIASKAKWS